MADRPHDGEQQYDPGPSFTDEIPGDEQLSDLPSWLQNFAASLDDDENEATSEPLDARPDQPEPSIAPELAAADPEIPDWLSSPRHNVLLSDTTMQAAGGDFFSEDDLPEWLRALSSDGGSHGTAASGSLNGSAGVFDHSSTAASKRAISVPSISNVWVTGMETPIENPGASLFAAIAAGGENRPDVAIASSPPVAQTNSSRRASRQPSEVEVGDAGRRTGWTRRERILLVAVIIMTIVMLLVLNTNLGG
jgi:hypothetical protein